MDRLMPAQVNLGQHLPFYVYEILANPSEDDLRDVSLYEGRTLFKFKLPHWQRPFVWTQDKCVRFMESLWLGIPVGTYTYVCDFTSPYNHYLIDGQQRITALHKYVNDEFPVFGYKYSEITELDRRMLKLSHFSAYRITGKYAKDEQYLKNYYNIMNFSGTPHTPDQKA